MSGKNEVASEAKPIRVGVYQTLTKAEHAVDELVKNGFTESEITVFCSAEWQQKHFEAERPPKTGLPVQNLVGGGILGGLLGGLVTVAGLATTAGIPVVIAGGLAGLCSGGVVGGLVGLMVHRGVELEPADFFDQAVARGWILVAVEPNDPERLDEADEVLQDAGAEPVPLSEG